jgi:hypothetical protein
VQIWKQQPAGYNTGAIVGTAKTARDYRFNPDQWNHYQITAQGDHVVVSPSPSGTSKSVRFPELTSAGCPSMRPDAAAILLLEH